MKVLNPRLVAFARRLDPLWRLVAPFLPRRPEPAYDVREILVVDLHLIGDIVMLTPLLAAIRVRHPRARIALLAGAWARTVLLGLDTVDEVIDFDAPWVKGRWTWRSVRALAGTVRHLRGRRWDLGLDVRGDVRNIALLCVAGCARRHGFAFTGGASLLTCVVPDDGRLDHILAHHERLATSIGAVVTAPFVPRLALTADERARADAVPPFVGFHFGASLPLRRLPPAAAAALVVLRTRPGVPSVLFAAPDLADYLDAVVALLPPPTRSAASRWEGDLRAFIVHASRALEMIAMDSGPAHVAAALGRRTIVFFGPNLPEIAGPRGDDVVVIEDRSVPCRPCDQRHCINPVHQACMASLVPRLPNLR